MPSKPLRMIRVLTTVASFEAERARKVASSTLHDAWAKLGLD